MNEFYLPLLLAPDSKDWVSGAKSNDNTLSSSKSSVEMKRGFILFALPDSQPPTINPPFTEGHLQSHSTKRDNTVNWRHMSMSRRFIATTCN